MWNLLGLMLKLPGAVLLRVAQFLVQIVALSRSHYLDLIIHMFGLASKAIQLNNLTPDRKGTTLR